MNIYVGNLSYGVTEVELREMFSKFGEVTSVNLISDKYSGQSKGFGFVEMAVQSEAEAAIKALDGNSVKGRNLRVNEARPRSERPRGRGRY
ncbi:MAG: RNA-binding protein [Gammaproteobacteria bacterium]|nr:RNA-binding protein [Gammaproteobacteria bacterium]